jgi:hypothetical protein
MADEKDASSAMSSCTNRPPVSRREGPCQVWRLVRESIPQILGKVVKSKKAILEALQNRKVVDLLGKGAKIDPPLLSLKRSELASGTES